MGKQMEHVLNEDERFRLKELLETRLKNQRIKAANSKGGSYKTEAHDARYKDAKRSLASILTALNELLAPHIRQMRSEKTSWGKIKEQFGINNTILNEIRELSNID